MVKDRKAEVLVVGAGIGGLATASLLARQGRSVLVLEKNAQVGGRARSWEKDGFRFDMGPSWYLMPEVFEHFFSLFKRKREDFYSLRRLDPAYKVFFEPGEAVEIGSDQNQVKAIFDGFEPGGGQKLERYLQQARYKYDIAMQEFLYKNYRSVFDFFNRKLLIQGTRLNVFDRLDRFVGRYFSDRRAKQILEYAMIFLGTSPQRAPALYSIMSHVDLNLGVFYPHGGLASVSRGMLRLAESLGVDIRTGQEVREMVVRKGRVREVRTAEGSFTADVVVVNADYAHSETKLLSDRARSFPKRYWEKRVWAPSMFILYLGLNRRLESLRHHNLYFAPDWSKHFDTIFETPAWPEAPCFYVSCISKSDRDAAPQGGENVFVLVPVAPGLDDNELQRERYSRHVLEHLERVTGESIRDSMTVKRIYSHRDFTRDYNAYGGTALGLSHTLGQTAIFRPSLKSKRVSNLYYAGQYTHPGVGVPMVLIAAQVVSRLIQEDGK